jgi:superfamily II DNA or RNA helicase
MWKQIIEERNLTEFKYQSNFWSNEKHLSPDKPLVLAFGTNGGKTTTSIVLVEMYYRLNNNMKVIVAPHAQNILRDNYVDDLIKFNPSFKYCVATNRKDLENIPDDCNMIIALPQTLSKSLDILPEGIDWLIVDEAHEWYFANTYTNLIKTIKPKYQLLLTGTPFQFNARRDEFMFYYVSVDQLRSEGKAGDPLIQIVSTSFNLHKEDYTQADNLTASYNFSPKENKKSIHKVSKHLVKTLSNPIKNSPTFNRITKDSLSVFGYIDKTIIIAHNTNMANDFYTELNNNKVLKNKVLVSHSKIDNDSAEFIRFQKDNNYKVLIVVNRGRLGFSMDELFNIVDFSFTNNVSTILQILGRLLRLSKLQPNKQKIYYKVASRNTVGYVTDIMTGTLGLTLQEYYESFTGDFGSVKVPRISPNKPREPRNNENENRASNNINTRPISNFMEMGLLNLEFFKQIFYKQNDEFAITAWTTLDEVKRKTFNIGKAKTKKFVGVDWNKKENHTEYHKYNSITDYTNNYCFSAGQAVTDNEWKKEFWPNGSKKTFTEEHKAKIKAKKSTKEAKEHHSKLITGRKKGPMSEEQKRKISEANKNNWQDSNKYNTRKMTLINN